ncbi:heavy metal-associated isoprenylated plant protein 8-like [Juglans microcarpa x Juglans regia]|uniref:heavy metal-associated isoprenylated plant protein 8-like n=1 Tax=Juglans microcarpa x Juglans regia TaxID=2249226 RepID=UPI001B7F0E2B|nr:heavy metal-associated isoprenylated plant protein 8-like [Juglans microcarpa x Juglans regia]
MDNGSNAPNTHCDDIIVLKAYMHCDGCCRKVFKCLKCLEGVEDVVIDIANHLVVVKGKKADPLKVLKRLQKKYSRNAELISPKFHNTEVRKEPEKKKEVEVKIVVLKMFMHCEGCVNDVKKNIERMTGILSVEPNMEASQVTVRGAFEVAKLVEDIKKRLGKHVEIVEHEEEAAAEGGNQEGIDQLGEYYIFQYPPQYCLMHCAHHDLTQMFNDENVFSCSIIFAGKGPRAPHAPSPREAKRSTGS